MARSLARNTKLFVTTLTRPNITTDNMLLTNTWEVKVLDGYSFSQDTASQEIGVSEAASEAACAAGGLARGTQSFNTALNPVDVSFSTYVRPYQNGSSNGDCVEKILWASAMGTADGLTASPDTPANLATYNQDTNSITFSLATSNANELLPLTLCFVLENATYVVEQFNVGTAEVDFSIDGIATINWSGNGSRVNEDQRIHSILKTGGTAVSGTDYTAVPATTTTTFLRNKLSTLELSDAAPVSTLESFVDGQIFTTYVVATGVMTYSDLGSISAEVEAGLPGGRAHNETLDQWATIVAVTKGSDTITIADADRQLVDNWTASSDAVSLYTKTQFSGTVYCVPITGGTLTLENNLTYLTPEELAIVNLPLAGFAGNRVTSGSFTAYLNTGAQGTGGLLQDLLNKIETSVTTNFALTFHMGNATTAVPRVDFVIPHAQVSIPTTNVEDIISTEISFTAKPWDAANSTASFEDTNEMTISYVSA